MQTIRGILIFIGYLIKRFWMRGYAATFYRISNKMRYATHYRDFPDAVDEWLDLCNKLFFSSADTVVMPNQYRLKDGAVISICSLGSSAYRVDIIYPDGVCLNFELRRNGWLPSFEFAYNWNDGEWQTFAR